MTVWITGKVPDGSGRIITAEKRIWKINIHQKYFTNVVLILAELFSDNICQICLSEHYSKSGMIRCIKSHASASVNWFLEKVLS